MINNNNENGYLDVKIGPMFSGKSTTLLKETRLLDELELEYIIINHINDERYGKNVVSTHNKEQKECISLKDITNLLEKDNKYNKLYKKVRYIFIEEAQFFEDLKEFIIRAVDIDKKIVYVYGLDGSSNRKMFNPIYDIIPLSDNIKKLKALCKRCKDGTPAIFTKRKINKGGEILVGTSDIYESVCRKCFLENI